MKTEIRPYDDSPSRISPPVPMGPYAIQNANRRIAPEVAKPAAPVPFSSPVAAPKTMGRSSVQYDRVPRQRKSSMPVDRDTCHHPKWEKQGKEGTPRSRFEKCARCGKSRTCGEKKAMGRPREFEKVPYHECSHPMESRVPRIKLGTQREGCKMCDRLVPVRALRGSPHLIPVQDQVNVPPPSPNSGTV